jgi:hypothetical protein
VVTEQMVITAAGGAGLADSRTGVGQMGFIDVTARIVMRVMTQAARRRLAVDLLAATVNAGER